MKKAPWVKTCGAFFVPFFLILTAFVSAKGLSGGGDCPAQGPVEVAQLAKINVGYQDGIHDGDSLRLTDGRKVRLIGVNTPELAREGRPAEALAVEARQAAVDFFGADRRVHLIVGPEARDRYGRLLANVYNRHGQSLAAELLARGLAFHIVIPPNLALAACLARIEAKARDRGLGVWSHKDWQPLWARDLQAGNAGFRRLSGRVLAVTQKTHVWVKMDGPVLIKVAGKDLEYFPIGLDWSDLQGKEIEVRGWLIDRFDQFGGEKSSSGRWLMNLRTFYGLSDRKETKTGAFGS